MEAEFLGRRSWRPQRETLMAFQAFLCVWALAFFASMSALTAEAKTNEASGEANGQSFGVRLVQAAKAQTATLVMYDPSYRKIDYPMGDVPWYLGVCTDVVVRAYRDLGIDLQVLIHESRLGSGDPNIDHRRVNVMRKFFQKHGVSLPVSENPKNFEPGDLVTYHVPDGTFSKTHIAIVSDRASWSGRPMVIHNRGYGVREEDWLFEAKITGHFRFQADPNIAGWTRK